RDVGSREELDPTYAKRACYLQLQFLPSLTERAQAQRVEPDEAGGVAMVIGDGAFLERHEILVVERVLRRAADNGDAALVKAELDRAGNELLRTIDRGLQHLALGREPEAVVDQLGVFWHQLVLEVGSPAIERDRFDAAVRR